MNLSIKLSFILFVIILFSFIKINAQTFEGKIISKDISINIIALDEIMYEDEEEIEGNYEEDDYSLDGPQIPKKIMDKYFALSMDEMKKAVEKYKSEFDAEYMDSPLYEETTSEIFIKGSKIRADTEEEGMKMSMIIDTESPVAKIIRWDQKVVINMNFEKMKKQMDAALEKYNSENDNNYQNNSSLQSTGETKEINGFVSELYKGTDAENNYKHVWLSKSVDGGLVKSFSKMSELFAKLNPEESGDSELEFYVNNNSIPILTKSMSGGEMIHIEEILKIEEKAIDNSEFEVPKGFKEMDMSQMIQQEFE